MNDHEKVLRRIRSEKEGAIAIARGITGLDFIDEHIAKVDAEIAAIDYAIAAIGERGEPWRPIESAPKDGTTALLFWPAGTLYGNGYVEIGRWDADRYAKTPNPFWHGSMPNNRTRYRAHPPTMWQPIILPTPPTQGAQPNEEKGNG